MPKSNGNTAAGGKKNNNIFIQILLKIIPNWVTPNLLSILRLAMIPAIAVCLTLGYYAATLVLFISAALLDTLDGTLARARNQISDWGLILDPLADKLLIIALVSFLLLIYPFKLLIIYVLVFDLFIILISVLQIGQPGIKIKPANIWGKSKMLAQVIGLSLALLWLAYPAIPLLYASALIIWLSLALQIKSAVSYL
ncbi:MAG: CDP-alcohol phosphatidyltransferase family protein [Patescibacteria group bacterium]